MVRDAKFLQLPKHLELISKYSPVQQFDLNYKGNKKEKRKVESLLPDTVWPTPEETLREAEAGGSRI